MSIKSTIAAVAASPFLFAGAAFAGPYVNLEANGSYPAGNYEGGNLEAQVGYAGSTEGGLDWYASVGPTIPHSDTEDANGDKFGDIELAGYLGASKSITESVSAYGEVYGQTTTGDDNAYSAKAGLTFEF